MNTKIVFFLLVLLYLSPVQAQKCTVVPDQFDRENYSLCIKLLSEPGANNTHNAHGLFFLGCAYLETGDSISASATFSRLTADFGTQPIASFGSGAMFAWAGDTTLAVRMLQDGISKLNEKNGNEILLLAIAAHYGTDPLLALAISELKNREQQFLHSAEYYNALGALYLKLRDANEAGKCFRRALELNSLCQRTLLNRAMVYQKIRSYSSAIATLQEIQIIDSLYAPAYRLKAEILKEQDTVNEAADNYSIFVQLAGESLPRNEKLARLLFQSERYNECLKVIDRLQLSDPANADYLQFRAYVYHAMNDSVNSASAFQAYLTHDMVHTASATDYFYFAEDLAKLSLDSAAVENYRRSIELDPEKAEYYTKLVGLLIKMKRFEEVIAYSDKKVSLAHAPLSLKELFDYGTAQFYIKNYVKADSVFGEVNEMKPDLSLGYLWRAFSAAQLDSTSEAGLAKPYYEKFIEYTKNDESKFKTQLVSAYAYMGYYYYLRKDDPDFKTSWLERYKYYWTEVLRLDPTNKQATEALKGYR